MTARKTGRTGRAWRPLDDDEVLAWWEAFDKGETMAVIAEKWERPLELVFGELEALGVLYDVSTDTPRGRSPKGEEKVLPIDRALVKRVVCFGPNSEEEGKLLEALAVLRGMPDQMSQPQPTMRLNLHLPNARSHQPMSARERRMNEMASSKWRRIVAMDMRRMGIMR